MKTISVAVFCVLLLLACSKNRTVDTIKNHPRKYIHKTVQVEGNVGKSFSLLFFSYFELQDSTGTIPVITKKPLPAKGEKIKIKGVVKYYSLGSERVISIEES